MFGQFEEHFFWAAHKMKSTWKVGNVASYVELTNLEQMLLS
jgi:hypothetical protein